MRQLLRRFIRHISLTMPVKEPIYEFGSFQLPGQEGFADLRPFFKGKRYIGADIRKGPGVDRIIDLRRTKLPSRCAGTVLVLDTLEHIHEPQKAVEEAYRILKPGGLLVISSVMFFPIHDYPFDFWRFTPESFNHLLRPFTSSLVATAGDPSFPHTVIGVGIKGKTPKKLLADLGKAIRRKGLLRGGIKEFSMLTIPPFLSLPLYRILLKKSTYKPSAGGKKKTKR